MSVAGHRTRAADLLPAFQRNGELRTRGTRECADRAQIASQRRRLTGTTVELAERQQHGPAERTRQADTTGGRRHRGETSAEQRVPLARYNPEPAPKASEVSVSTALNAMPTESARLRRRPGCGARRRRLRSRRRCCPASAAGTLPSRLQARPALRVRAGEGARTRSPGLPPPPPVQASHRRSR